MQRRGLHPERVPKRRGGRAPLYYTQLKGRRVCELKGRRVCVSMCVVVGPGGLLLPLPAWRAGTAGVGAGCVAY